MQTRGSILVLGGCRSGKSGHALKLAQGWDPGKRYFLATCVPGDEELERRVEQHRRDRGEGWITLEEPLDLPQALREHDASDALLLADCLTMWVSNLLARNEDEESIRRRFRDLGRVVESARARLILVSNEVGLGIVPESDLTRRFRDLAGYLNQETARRATGVVWMVAGIPVTVK
jgi:adenosylcobinamide kinase/adenosylcobinamide-phosphate guanylyltransferase